MTTRENLASENALRSRDVGVEVVNVKSHEQCNLEGTTDDEQYVEVYIRTGVDEDLATDIARGLNTGMQVAAKSIYNIDGVFDWLKDEIKGKPYDEMIAWRESDNKEYDVRDLIGVLELFNVFDFPNEVSKHPWSMHYEKAPRLRKSKLNVALAPLSYGG